MKPFILFLSFVFLAISQINLVEVPTELLTYLKVKDGNKKSEVRVSWLSSYNASQVFFRYSKTPGLSQLETDNTSEKLTFGVVSNGIKFKPAEFEPPLRPGVYYCYIQDINDKSIKSAEFQMVIEADTSPLNFRPSDGDASLDGVLSWEDPENDTPPYFHVLVSDEPIKLKEDEDGNITIDSAKIVYQAIVPRADIGGSIQYGVPDPSGHFDNVSTVPLVHEKSYYWAALNNYGNHPALTSAITPSKIASFVYQNAETYLPETELVAPAQNEEFNQSASITFQWDLIPNESPDYELNIYEEREVDGNTFSFLIKQVVLNSTSSSFELADAQTTLRTTKYSWNIIARDGQKVSVSKTRHLSYIAPPSKTLKFLLRKVIIIIY